jgi:hypothetical protein
MKESAEKRRRFEKHKSVGELESIEAYQPKLKSERELDSYCARFHQTPATDENGMYQIY